MTGENFKRINRNTQVKDIKSEIYNLQLKCNELIKASKKTESPLPEIFWRITKEIEWNEYLLWGAKEGILR